MASPHQVDREHSFVNAISQTYARYCPAVMRRITTAFLAALRSLVRKTSFLHRSFTTWYVRLVAARKAHTKPSGSKSLELFTEEVERLLEEVLDTESLARLSAGLQKQFKNALKSDMSCMLPSYNHQLPQGTERGTYLALDVGGSTFRLALIQLSGPQDDDSGMKILSLKAYKIDDPIKQLVGVAFFDWMAARIEDTISGHPSYLAMDGDLSTGLAWSFPIEQTSLRSGMMQGMGKGFMAAQGLLGHDLGDLIQEACSRKNLKVRLNAIVNDSSATLLSKGYSNTDTRYGLILGTGVNIAVHLPVHVLQPEKFGVRPAAWHDEAKHVIVNTELGMFGKGLLPLTRWDDQLNADHILPGFQPFEHLVSGRYLGEISRLIIVEGVRSAGLFSGCLPPSLERPYSLDTEVLARIESSTTTQAARDIFTSNHPSPTTPSDADIRALRLIFSDVSIRSSALVAASIHALWELRRSSEQSTLTALDPSSLTTSPSPTPSNIDITNGPITNGNGNLNGTHHPQPKNAAQPDTSEHAHSIVACNGSVIELYPGFRTSCQRYLDLLIARSGGKQGSVELAVANESSLRGAAVAVAVMG